MKKRAKQKRHISKSGILISSAYGLLCATVILILLLAIFSAVGLATENPHSLLTPISFFSIYTASFFGGFIAIKKNKGADALLCGLVCGIFTFLFLSLIFFIIGIILKSQSASLTWLFRALIIPASILGSLLGSAKKNKMPKRKKRR